MAERGGGYFRILGLETVPGVAVSLKGILCDYLREHCMFGVFNFDKIDLAMREKAPAESLFPRPRG